MSVSNLLFPARCIACGAHVSEQQHGICADCHRAVRAEMQCRHLPPKYVDAFVCAGSYTGGLGRAVRSLKFYPQQFNINPLALLMLEAWDMHRMPQPTLVTCVPISAARAHLRGFNQSAALAQYIAAAWNVPFAHTLKRHLLSRRQSKLHAQERWSNAKKAYYARDDVDLTGETVVLVDDVVTTGATASTCAMLLRDMGAQTVLLLSATRTGARKIH